MMNTLFNTLDSMGFVAHSGGMMWGFGSYMAAGTILTVAHEGKGYAVAYRSWFYDENGELIHDQREEHWLRRHKDVIVLVNQLMK